MGLCGDRRRPSFRSIKLKGFPRRVSSVAAIGSGKAICVDYSDASGTPRLVIPQHIIDDPTGHSDDQFKILDTDSLESLATIPKPSASSYVCWPRNIFHEGLDDTPVCAVVEVGGLPLRKCRIHFYRSRRDTRNAGQGIQSTSQDTKIQPAPSVPNIRPDA